jgi:hypothetical protein
LLNREDGKSNSTAILLLVNDQYGLIPCSYEYN